MPKDKLRRRDFVRTSAAAGVAATVSAAAASTSEAEEAAADQETLTNGMPYGTIGDLKISRLILGSNTPGAHSRDLIYVSALGRAYNTPERMLDTYELAESQGINTTLQGNLNLIRTYNTQRGGNLRTISPVRVTKNDDKESIRKTLTAAMKNDLAAAFYIMGDRGDYLARANRMDVAGTAMEVAKELGIVLGIGGHSLEVPIQCEQLGIKPDFYVKTFHDDNYWSATPKENREPFCWYDDTGGNSHSGKTGDHNRFHDNIWCLEDNALENKWETERCAWSEPASDVHGSDTRVVHRDFVLAPFGGANQRRNEALPRSALRHGSRLGDGAHPRRTLRHGKCCRRTGPIGKRRSAVRGAA